MSRVCFAVLLLPLVTVAQGDGRLPMLAGARIVEDFPQAWTQVVLGSSDWCLLETSEGKWSGRHLVTGHTVEPPAAAISAAALAPDGTMAFLASGDGQVWRRDLTGSSAVWEELRGVSDGWKITELAVSPTGLQLGWYAREKSVAGVFDLASKKGVWSAALTVPRMSSYGPPHFLFDRSGRWLVGFQPLGASVRTADEEVEAGRAWDLENGEVATTFRPYLASTTPGYAVGDGFLVFGRREESQIWSLLHHDLRTATTKVIDADARGRHFVDLYVAPSGRRMVEWDFEEPSIRVYDLSAESGGAALSIGNERTDFLGFDHHQDGGDRLLTRGPEGTGLRFWTADGREFRDLPILQNCRVESAKVSSNGRYLAVRATAEDEVLCLVFRLGQ